MGDSKCETFLSPYGGWFLASSLRPTACAVGCILLPLRIGWHRVRLRPNSPLHHNNVALQTKPLT